MSRKELLLKQLESDFGDISGSLLYRAIELSSSIITDGRIAIYITGSGYLRMFRPTLTIELTNGRIVVRLPKYCKQPIYTCAIDGNYLSANSIKLISVFRIIYRDAIDRISRSSCVSHLESLMLAGIFRDNGNMDMIKVFHKDGVYFDNIHRCSTFFNVLIGEILLTNHRYDVIDILDCFGGVITDENIDDRLKPSILYLNNQSIADIDQLKKYTSLKFVDIGDAELVPLVNMGISSIRLNGNQVIGVDPILDFLTLP